MQGVTHAGRRHHVRHGHIDRAGAAHYSGDPVGLVSARNAASGADAGFKREVGGDETVVLTRKMVWIRLPEPISYPM